MGTGAAFVAFAAVLAFTGLAPPAHAVPEQQTPQGEQGSVVNSWSLTPTRMDPGAVGARSNLSYTVAPGSKIEDSVTLANYSNVPLTFELYATDAENTETGEFSLRPSAKAARDAGTWIKLGLGTVTLPATTSVTVPVTLTVPEDATPGDHAAGIVASSTTPALNDAGDQVMLERRVGTRVYLRVPGPLNPHLEIEQLDVKYKSSLNPLDGTVEMTYRIRNTGNVRLGTKQRVSVSDLFGEAGARRLPPIDELVPGSAATVTTEFSGVAATVRISGDVELEPFAVRGSDVSAPAAFSRSASAWAIPWLLLAVLAILVAAAWWYRRRRAKQARRGGASPPPTAHNGAPRPATQQDARVSTGRTAGGQ